MIENSVESIEIAEKECSPFIGGESPGKTDGQDLGIQGLVSDAISLAVAPT